jgi:uncharacterized protein YjbI with pentapeptide repeats
MNRIDLARGALLSLALLAALPALAADQSRDSGRDGPVLQGISLNGPILQGLQLNGPVLQGQHLNGPGLVLQGVVLNGPTLVVQGRNLNGVAFNGVAFNGRAFNGRAFNGPGVVLQGPALFGEGKGVFAHARSGASAGVPGHSPLSGIASASIMVALPER